jgi:hypothetical protein
MAPVSVKIIAYNVGFGDCMLLRFDYGDEDRRHVLIDFGTTKLPSKFKPPSMKAVAEAIREDCGGRLEMVVATHRHADHISGFAGESGEIIHSLRPDVVVQPWTEKPDLETDATGPALAAAASDVSTPRGFVARLDSLHEAARLVGDQIPRIKATNGVTQTAAQQLAFLGETNLKNRPAVEALQRLGKRRVYAAFGTDLRVGKLFPGVKVEVLGPPTLRQSSEIATMARVDDDEFWHLAASSGDEVAAGGGKPLFPSANISRTTPLAARWLVPRINRMQAEELLSLVRTLDSVMNNTSLILLFTIGDFRLLFPGDAQLENWRYALELAPNADSIRRRLADTRVYKVGHHGSLNATPKELLWHRFERRGPASTDGRLITVLSTAGGKHGQESQGTEVPRRRLVDTLKAESKLVNTQDCNKKTGWRREVDVPL